MREALGSRQIGAGGGARSSPGKPQATNRPAHFGVRVTGGEEKSLLFSLLVLAARGTGGPSDPTFGGGGKLHRR